MILVEALRLLFFNLELFAPEYWAGWIDDTSESENDRIRRLAKMELFYWFTFIPVLYVMYMFLNAFLHH